MGLEGIGDRVRIHVGIVIAEHGKAPRALDVGDDLGAAVGEGAIGPNWQRPHADVVAGEYNDVGLETVDATDYPAQIGRLTVLAVVEVADLHDTQAMHGFRQVGKLDGHFLDAELVPRDFAGVGSQAQTSDGSGLEEAAAGEAGGRLRSGLVSRKYLHLTIISTPRHIESVGTFRADLMELATGSADNEHGPAGIWQKVCLCLLRIPPLKTRALERGVGSS